MLRRDRCRATWDAMIRNARMGNIATAQARHVTGCATIPVPLALRWRKGTTLRCVAMQASLAIELFPFIGVWYGMRIMTAGTKKLTSTGDKATTRF